MYKTTYIKCYSIRINIDIINYPIWINYIYTYFKYGYGEYFAEKEQLRQNKREEKRREEKRRNDKKTVNMILRHFTEIKDILSFLPSVFCKL